MRISKFKLKNYVSFYDEDDKTDWVELTAGINIVLGANNAGKTALLDALSRARSRAPHRSESTIPSPESRDIPSTDIDIRYELTDNVLLEILRDHGQRSFVQLSEKDPSLIIQHIRTLLCNLSRERHLQFNASPYAIQIGDHRESLEVLTTMELPYYSFSLNENERIDFETEQVKDRLLAGEETWWQTIQRYVFRNVFKLQAERRIPAHADVACARELKSDASNLPQVLYTVEHCNNPTFCDFKRLVRCVFPNISEVTTRRISQLPDEDDYLEIYIGYDSMSFERNDLLIPLAGCGSGLAQVMAILLLIVTSKEDRVFLIDEPSTFLHPNATRGLSKILESFPRHQFILATHSPTAIMSIQQKRVLLVKRTGMVSKVSGVDVRDYAELEDALIELGSRRSDVFGMDAVIWVEGKTDEICFNLIMKEPLPSGVQIIGLVNTGDLEDKKHAKLAENIYEKLSGGVGVLPSTLAFVFDGDKRPDDYDEADSANGRTRYLKRQNYESYFLDYSNIAEILSELINNDGGQSPSEPCSAEKMQTWLDYNKAKDKFYPDGIQYDPDSWLEQIGGAKFLTAMFKALAHPTRKYKKVKDGEEITRRILANEPNHFQEIVDLMKSILQDDST